MICIAPVSWFSILEWYLIDVRRISICECVRCVSTNVKWERNWRDRKVGTRERIKSVCTIKAMAFVQRLNRFKILRTMTYWSEYRESTVQNAKYIKCEIVKYIECIWNLYEIVEKVIKWLLLLHWFFLFCMAISFLRVRTFYRTSTL